MVIHFHRRIDYFVADIDGQPLKTVKKTLSGRANAWINESHVWAVTDRKVILVVNNGLGIPDFFVHLPHTHWMAQKILTHPYKRHHPSVHLKGSSFSLPKKHLKSKPIRRSFNLLKEVVRNNPKSMWFAGDFLKVVVRGRGFYISLKNGVVYREDGRQICVRVGCKRHIPIYDIVLAKALAIVFQPNKIHTLFLSNRN